MRLVGLVAAAIAALLFPIGLGFRGRTAKLRYTARLTRIVVVTLAVLLGVAIIVALLTDLIVAVAVSIVMATVAVEVSLRVLAPVEARLACSFRTERLVERNVLHDQQIPARLVDAHGCAHEIAYLAHLL